MGKFKELFELNYGYPRWITLQGNHIYLRDQYTFDYDKLIHSNRKKEKLNLDDDEIESLKYYSGPDFYSINDILRNDREFFIERNYYIKRIDSAIEKNPLKEDTTLYQKLYRRTINPIINRAIENNELKEGFEFTEKAYSSTSKSKNQALRIREKGEVFVINAKKGHKAIDITELSEYGSEESEVLIARNTTYKVTKTEKKLEKYKFKNNIKEEEITYIYLDIVKQD